VSKLFAVSIVLVLHVFRNSSVLIVGTLYFLQDIRDLIYLSKLNNKGVIILNNFLSAWMRAKNIDRWSLETNLVNFNDATHSFECTVVGHMISVIDRDIYGSAINPERVAILCTYHESDEVGGMGDLNSRAKYFDPECTKAIKFLENIFEENLLKSLPQELQASFSELIVQKKGTREADICKAADDICAFLESQKEVLLGNQDFIDCHKSCEQKVKHWGEKFECVKYFIDHFLTGVNQSVDRMFNDVQRLPNSDN